MSYSTWQYSALSVQSPVVPIADCKGANFSVTLANSGGPAGSEVAQCYLSIVNTSAAVPGPRWWLVAFERVDLAAGGSTTLKFHVGMAQLSAIQEGTFERALVPTTFTLFCGGGQPHQPAQRSTSNVVNTTFRTDGAPAPLDKCGGGGR